MMTGIKPNRNSFFSSFHSFLIRLFQGNNTKRSESLPVDNNNGSYDIQNRIFALKNELQDLALEKKRIEETVINCDWYSVNKTTSAKERTIKQFEAREIGDVPSLMILKNDLLRRHELRLKKVEEEAIRLITDIRNLLSTHQLSQAKSVFDDLNLIIAEVESKQIRDAFKEAIMQWNNERKKIETETIRKKAIQQKQNKKEESLPPAHIDVPIVSNIEKEEHPMQASYDDLIERIKRDQSEEEEILKTLANIDPGKKRSHRSIESILKKANIRHLYHYTDKRNLASINKHGGLLSMSFLSSHNINVPAAIGDCISHNIDKDLHIEDYVKLLPYIDYKAINRLKEDRDMVVLKIDCAVLLFKDSVFVLKTLFDEDLQLSDDYRTLVTDLRKVTFLVKTYIPKKLIVEVINC